MARIDPTHYDVIIVGARPAGSSLAIQLAELGMKVAAVDKATFPSDIMSTHVVYPNTLARFDKLGVLDRIMENGPPPLYTAWYHRGRMFVAPHAEQDGRNWGLCVRRITLDSILVDRAREQGADIIEDFTVTGFVGEGTDESPLRGIIGEKNGETVALTAPVIVGADGVNSTLARHVSAQKTKVMPTETMLYYAYWKGLPSRNTQDFFFECPWVCAHFPADNGYHVVTMNGPVEERRQIKDLNAFYLDKINSIPQLAARLRDAEMVSRVQGTTRLDGFYREHSGAGWLLTGDAAHFKHPASAQGICDALHAAEILAPMIADGIWRSAYPEWREAESREMYAFCKHLREAPTDEAISAVMDAAIADAVLAQKLVDVWARTAHPFDEVVPHIEGADKVIGPGVDEVLAPFEQTLMKAAV